MVENQPRLNAYATLLGDDVFQERFGTPFVQPNIESKMRMDCTLLLSNQESSRLTRVSGNGMRFLAIPHWQYEQLM